MERRLCAILAADMVGYSRLLETDEIGTIERQKQHRGELIDPEIESHRGRIVKTTGDGLIAEFSSVVDAVQCAVTVQREMASREGDAGDDLRIQYRIGINLGDVLVDDDGDIYGDGVNVAARLEQLADPGGICISGTTFDHLKTQVAVGYEAMGDVKVRNMDRPVRAYRVVADPASSATAARGDSRGAAPRSAIDAHIAPARQEQFAYAIPEKPSIAVMPFDTIGSNTDADWLSRGLSVSVISALAASPDMIVISQNALENMRGVEPGGIAERYGVRYVLDGTMQSNGQRVRVGARLSDAIKGQTLWAATWDKTTDDVFAIQDEIAEQIFEELQVKLTLGEQARLWRDRMGSSENMRLLLAGRAAFQTFSPEGHALAARNFNEIYRRNPELPVAIYLQGWLFWHKIMVGLSTDPAADLLAAQDWAQRAIDAGGSGTVDSLMAVISNELGQVEKAVAYADKALVAAPGEAEVVMLAGYVIQCRGDLKRGIELMLKAMRLEPDYPEWVGLTMARAFIQNGQHEEALGMARSLLSPSVKDAGARGTAYMNMAVASVFTNRIEDARGHVEKLREVWPDATRRSIETNPRLAMGLLSDRAFVKRYLDALVAAGLPD